MTATDIRKIEARPPRLPHSRARLRGGKIDLPGLGVRASRPPRDGRAGHCPALRRARREELPRRQGHLSARKLHDEVQPRRERGSRRGSRASRGFIPPRTRPIARARSSSCGDLERSLAAITGMEAFTLQPAAGAHGELTGIMIARAYFLDRGEKRRIVLIPDSAHGTNPASVAICGFTPKTIASNERGLIDPALLERELTADTACLMLTLPNTLGLFEREIAEIVRIVHAKGALVYMDGANMNALLGIVRPGDIGIDIMHTESPQDLLDAARRGRTGFGPRRRREASRRFSSRSARDGAEGRVRAFRGRSEIDRQGPSLPRQLQRVREGVRLHPRRSAGRGSGRSRRTRFSTRTIFWRV